MYAQHYKEQFVKAYACGERFSACSFRGLVIGAHKSRHHNSSFVTCIRKHLESDIVQQAQIQYFSRPNILLKQEDGSNIVQSVICAQLSFYQEHPELRHFPPPNEIWCNYFSSDGFVFLEKIICKFAYNTKLIMDKRKFLLLYPLIQLQVSINFRHLRGWRV